MINLLKNITLFSLFIILCSSSALYGQVEIIAHAYPTEVCPGDAVLLSASGGGTYYPTPTFTPLNANVHYNNPCGPGPNSYHIWLTYNDSLAPSLTSDIVNIPAQGSTLRWWMRYGTSKDTGICNAPDWPNEGVLLQYSTDSGATWNNFPGPNVEPTGNLSLTSPFITSTPGSGTYWQPYYTQSAQQNSELYFWNEYINTIPPGAVTPHTMFRFMQPSSSGPGHDTWGIDELELEYNTGNLNIQWSHGPQVLNPVAVSLPAKGYSYDTCFVVTITDSVYFDADTVCITVNSIPQPLIVHQQINSNEILYSDNSFTVNPDYLNAQRKWTFGPNATPSSSTQQAVQVNYNTPGTYTAKLELKWKGCTGFDTVNNVITSNTFNYANNDILIYPSPASEEIKLELPDIIKGAVKMRVYNMQGKLMFQKEILDQISLISIETLTAGSYYMEISNENYKTGRKFTVK